MAAPGAWERMKEEYSVLNLFPSGHIMAQMRSRFNSNILCSKDLKNLRDGSVINTVGLVIRRQRPQGKVVFITLEDEFGHIPLMIFPKVYAKNEFLFKLPFLIVKGRITRREGTFNVVVEKVSAFNAMEKQLQSKDWH